MRLSLRLAGLFGVFTAAASACFAWGYEGHKTVGDLARLHLSPEARSQVEAILGNDDLAAVASWPDDVRSAVHNYGALRSDPEAHEFNKKFPNNQNWHFVDMPPGYPGYTDDGRFSNPEDIVHSLKRAIATLEGADSGMTKAQALKYVIHLTGDLHQPLHTTCGYYDFSDPEHVKLITDFSEIVLASKDGAPPTPKDDGGNALTYAEHRGLHSYWDTGLLERIAGRDEGKLVSILKDREPKGWQSPGDYHDWPELWASESAKVATEKVFQGLVFGAMTPKEEKHPMEIQITLPEGYAERAEPVVEDQLAKAGLRLADLLNHIQWAK